jgi:REP element-mobilizing transposase RayT
MTDLPTRRNSLRYPGFDYASSAGAFVTICTHNRQPLFGAVASDSVQLTDAGRSLERRWLQIPQRHTGVAIDDAMIMPDHMHGILWFGVDDSPHIDTCSDVVRMLKILVQRDYAGLVRHGYPRYDGSLWQRGFYDHIIRGEHDLDAIRQYIEGNPARWREKRWRTTLG